eukprot:scaffold1828_cov98-Cylindrotheca_fusiformis.AAC.4
MMKSLLLTLFAASATAFAPPQQQQLGRRHPSVSVLQSSPDSAEDLPFDPFDSFGPDETEIAVRDLTIGQGETVSDGDVATVKYVGRLIENRQQFGKVEALPIKMGQGDLVKGFEQSLLGKKVGSSYIVRIPASLAWGDRGKVSPSSGRQVIPPGSALEFEVEVLNVSNGIMGELELFGMDRVLTLIFCISLIAGAPYIDKVVNGYLASQ